MRRAFKYVGLPRTIVSDNGTNFVSDEFECFLQSNYVKHVRTPPGHHQSNGLAERKIQELKLWLDKQANPGELDVQLIVFCLHLNTTPAANDAVPAAFVFFKTPSTRLSAESTEQELSTQPRPIYINNQPSILTAKHVTNTFIDDRDRIVHAGDIKDRPDPPQQTGIGTRVRRHVWRTIARSDRDAFAVSKRTRTSATRPLSTELIRGCCVRAHGAWFVSGDGSENYYVKALHTKALLL